MTKDKTISFAEAPDLPDTTMNRIFLVKIAVG